MDIAISTGLDLLIAVIFILTIIWGMRKGLVKTAIGLCGKILALIIAFVFSANLGAYIDSNYIHAPMRQWLVNRLSPTAENIQASLEDLDLDALFTDRPEFFTSTAEFLNIDLDALYAKYVEIKTNGVDFAKSAVTDAMVTPLSETISRVIAFVIIFLVCCVAIAVLWWLSDLVINVPVIRQLDKFGGALVGLINGFLITFILTSLLSVSLGYILKDTTIDTRDKIIENTIVFEFFNDINPLNGFFGKW